MALIRSVFQDELDGVSQSLVDLTEMVALSISKATQSSKNMLRIMAAVLLFLVLLFLFFYSCSSLLVLLFLFL